MPSEQPPPTVRKLIWKTTVLLCNKLLTAIPAYLTLTKNALNRELWSVPKIRTSFQVFGTFAIPILIAVGFGVQAVNPMTEEFHAVLWFSAAALCAGVVVAVMKDIRPPKAWARVLVICALEGAIVGSLHYSLKWVSEKADEAALGYMIRDSGASHLLAMESKWNQHRAESATTAQMTTQASVVSVPQLPRRLIREPLDVRGDNMCHAILDFAREAEQEEPAYMYSPNTPRDAIEAMNLNHKNIEARLSNEFDKRFGGPLASITQEFEARGIELEVHMAQPPPSAFEMQLGGKELCRMVYALRQKEGIPDPRMAERAQTYRTALRPCLGNPTTDDPFPTDRGDQVGVRAIDMANIIEKKADTCMNTLQAGGADRDAVRNNFTFDVIQCCLADIRRIHYSILSRCPTARDSRGEMAYSMFLQEKTSGRPSCNADDFAKYFRELGQTMKDATEWRPR